MVEWIGWLLKVVYLYGHLIGVRNFEFDWRTGRVYKSIRSTFYASGIHAIILISLAMMTFRHLNIWMIFGKSNMLLKYVLTLVFGLRILAGLSTVLIRWPQRTLMMQFARTVLRLFLQRPQVMQMSRWGVLFKIIITSVTDLLQVISIWIAWDRRRSDQTLGIFLQYWMSAIVNLAIAEHYLAILFVRAYYNLLNTELRQVMEECQKLSNHPQRRGAFMTRCCDLADQLDDIAQLQSELISMVTQLGEALGIQGLMVYGGYYIFSIATVYLSYSIFKTGYDNLDMTVTSMILTFIWCSFYYLDALLNLFITLNLLDDHKDIKRLLEERTLFASRLDIRLEESFDRMQLQLIQNPLKTDILKTFSITRESSMAMLGSVIMHSIILIQFDLEFF
ncbi:putative gustatory receptor 36a [Drosophila ficusphila]|uniref:putative gustatory receptor 36a n=1 Tax=Drosophila ficusphila TaxID=30025 RepID=UPI001C895088|nr:putative gustatory receptor 36a [Drosophila ficusphila]